MNIYPFLCRFASRGAVAFGVLVALALAPRPAEAQFGPGPRALGTAGAYTALARGHEAVYWNPANLALPDGPSFSLGLPNPAAVAAVLGPDFGSFEILTEESPTEAAQAAFLAEIPAAGVELRGDVTVPWLSFSAGRLGFGVSTTGLGRVEASRELLELYLDARDDGELNGRSIGSYRVGATGYRDAAFTEATVAYGISLDDAAIPVTVGIGARAFFGHRLERGRLFEPTVREDHLILSGVAISSGGGRGFGLDVGATARPAPGVTVGAAVQNLFQRVSWDDELELRGGDFTSRELDEEGIDGILDRFEARPFDPAAAPLEAFEVARGLLREAYLPRVVRLGAGYQRGGSSVGATFSSTVGGGDLHAGWPRYLAIGAEQRLSILTLRTGYANSLDGASALTVGAGLRLGAVHLMASAGRLTGSDESAAVGTADTLDGLRYSDRLAAGSGYGATIGISVVRR